MQKNNKNTMQLQLLDYCANKSSNDDFGNNNAIMQSNNKSKITQDREGN